MDNGQKSAYYTTILSGKNDRGQVQQSSLWAPFSPAQEVILHVTKYTESPPWSKYFEIFGSPLKYLDHALLERFYSSRKVEGEVGSSTNMTKNILYLSAWLYKA